MADRNYTVVARRYRPRQFADLVGQEPVAKALTNALNSGRVAHAYLFTGARGVGKTSSARILAKALNCAKGPTPTPCDECDICKSIAAGDDIDVLEIDGASNRGIDEIRAIRQNVNTMPARAKHKIYIVDEVHMLTGPAFNALLKTLEEPPAHVKFIFATTEVQKIPVTILSRCQRFDFAGIGTSKIAGQLKAIVEAEGMTADDAALNLVARRAGGSMRDAQSLLDQLLAFTGDGLTSEVVHQLLGTAADDRVTELAANVLKKDAPAALKQLAACSDEGLQLGELLDQLIEYWGALMRVNAAGDWPELPVSDAHIETLKGQAKAMSLDTILAGLDVLTTAKSRMRFSNHPLILLEMALVRLCRLEDLLPVSALTKMLAQGGVTVKKNDRPEIPTRLSDLSRVASAQPTPAVLPPSSLSPLPSSKPPISGEITEQNLPAVWQQVLDHLGGMFRGDVEKSGLPAITGPKSLRMRFPSTAQLAYDHCREAEKVARLESALKSVAGFAVSVSLELSPPEADTPTLVNGKTPSPEGAANAAPTAKSASSEGKRVMEVPLIREAIEVCEAKLLRYDPGFAAGFASGEPPVE